MNQTSILFPHLNLTLSHVGKSLSVGGFEVAYYGIVIALGMALGISLIFYLARKSGQSEDLYVDLTLVTIVCSIIGARGYYVLFSWEDYKDHLLEIFYIRGGGLAIYGGVLVGILTIFLFARRKKQSVWLLMDTVCPGLVVGQIIGRWGNFFNREAFGGYSDGLLAMALPRDAVRQGEITAQMLQHLKVIDGVEFIQVHPTFLYESLWNLLLLFCLLMLWKHRKYDGQIAACYLVGYGLGRIWIESLRTDQLLLPVIRIPVSQVVSGILILCSAIYMIKKHRQQSKTDTPTQGKKGKGKRYK